MQSSERIPSRRILSIDGGGIKGVFPAAFLASIEEEIDRPVAEYFDLIVGTSTGGIIAIGLGLGFSAHDLLNFYEREGPEIFGGNRGLRLLKSVNSSKYDSGPLRRALVGALGARKLGESNTRLVIPALDLESGRVHVKKTAHHARCERDFRDDAVDVAMATASAPTYFPTYRSQRGVPLIDGGVWANNPSGVAAVEAIGVLGWQQGSINLLSVGCTDSLLSVQAHRNRPMGLRHWSTEIMSVVMAGQSSGAIGTAQLLLGHDHVYRVSPVVGAGRYRLDRVRDLPALRGLGAAEARVHLPRLRTHFFSRVAEPFLPTRTL